MLKKIACFSLIFLTSCSLVSEETLKNNNKKLDELNSAFSILKEKNKILEDEIQALKSKLIVLQVESEINKLERGNGYLIDLTTPNIQKINELLYVGNLSVKPYLNGVMITGEINNFSSIFYYNSNFTIKINEEKKDFSIIKTIPPGTKASFEIFVQKTSDKDLQYARLKYVDGSIGTIKSN